MKPYYSDKWVTQHCSDAQTILTGLESDSIDLLCTDPPYGIGFMGKDWDKALPDKKIWAECFRVLKDGAFAFVMSIPRADCLSRMIISLEDAGFRVDFSPIYWAYASGFPKAQNMGKAVDKKLGAKREVVGNRRRNVKPYDDNAGWNQNDTQGDYEYTKPSTSQAKELDGSYGGFQPKPAVEVIIVAMKPLSEKTFVDQALKNGKGITWLDDCRIPYESETDKNSMDIRHYTDEDCFQNVKPKESKFQVKPPNQSGRFPANLICSDDVLNDGRVSKSGFAEIGSGTGKVSSSYSQATSRITSCYSDSGSFSRYFDLDKWAQKTFPFLIVPKASRFEKTKGLDKSVIIDIIEVWKENNITQEAKLAQLQVIMGTSHPKVTVESGTRSSTVLEWSMSWFGNHIMEKYQQAIASIIPTGTDSITASQIYNWLVFLLTNEYTGDVSLEMVNGGSPVENAGNSRQLIITMNERMVSRLGVNHVVSETQLKISVSARYPGHPTVKPLKLMSYLITLGSRAGDTVLDPFSGSGTTPLACQLLNRKCTAIETEEKYCEIAAKRCRQMIFTLET